MTKNISNSFYPYGFNRSWTCQLSYDLLSFVDLFYHCPTKTLCFARLHTQLLFRFIIFIALENFEIYLYSYSYWHFFYALGNCKTWVFLDYILSMTFESRTGNQPIQTIFLVSLPSHLFFFLQAIVIILKRVSDFKILVTLSFDE